MTNFVVQVTCIHSYSEHTVVRRRTKTTRKRLLLQIRDDEFCTVVQVTCTTCIHIVTVNIARTYTQAGKGSYSEYTIIQILLIYALTPL
jgi:hypothetical protein